MIWTPHIVEWTVDDQGIEARIEHIVKMIEPNNPTFSFTGPAPAAHTACDKSLRGSRIYFGEAHEGLAVTACKTCQEVYAVAMLRGVSKFLGNSEEETKKLIGSLKEEDDEGNPDT